jgi:hypothetical protein
LGGPIAFPGTVGPYESVYFDIPFIAADAARVSVAGSGWVDLFIHDSTGVTTWGVGVAEVKTAAMYVTGPGFFRVEVRNREPVTVSFVLRTN